MLRAGPARGTCPAQPWRRPVCKVPQLLPVGKGFGGPGLGAGQLFAAGRFQWTELEDTHTLRLTERREFIPMFLIPV